VRTPKLKSDPREAIPGRGCRGSAWSPGSEAWCGVVWPLRAFSVVGRYRTLAEARVRSLASRKRHPWPPCLWQPITLTRDASSLLAALADTSLSLVALSLYSRDQPSSRFRGRSASTTITSTRPRGARASLVWLSRCRAGALRCSLSQRDLTHLTAFEASPVRISTI